MSSSKDRIVSLPGELDSLISEASEILKEFEFRTILIAIRLGLEQIIGPEREKILTHRKSFKKFISALRGMPCREPVFCIEDNYEVLEKTLRDKSRKVLERKLSQELKPVIRRELEKELREKLRPTIHKKTEKKTETKPVVKVSASEDSKKNRDLTTKTNSSSTDTKKTTQALRDIEPKKESASSLVNSSKVIVTFEAPQPQEMIHLFYCGDEKCNAEINVPHHEYLLLKSALSRRGLTKPRCVRHGGYRHLLEHQMVKTS